MKKLLMALLLSIPVSAHATAFLNSVHGPWDVIASTTQYFIPGTGEVTGFTSETTAQITYYTPGTITGLWMMVNPNTLTQGATVQLRINGANGNNVLYVPSAGIGEFSASGALTDTISSGDKVDVQIITPSGGTSLSVLGFSYVFAATSNSMLKFTTADGLGQRCETNGFATFYTNVSGIFNYNQSQTETQNIYHMKTAGTFSHLGVRVSTSATVGNVTVRFRKNLANGNQLVTLLPGTSGYWQDNTNTDTVVSGDTITISIAMNAASDGKNLCLVGTSLEFTTTNGAMEYPAQTAGHNIAAGSDQFSPIQGALGFDASEVNDYQVLSQVTGTLSNMHTYVNANTSNVVSTIRMRKNAGNLTQVLTIPAGQTGYFEDTTHTDAVLTTDKLDYELSAPAGSGNVTFNYVGSLMTAGSASTPAVLGYILIK